MKNKIVALVASIVMMFGLTVAVAPAANAHAYVCGKIVNAPIRTTTMNYIGSYTAHKCRLEDDRPYHHKYVHVTSWVEVWAPNGYGGGTWRRIGHKDYDVDRRVAVAAPRTALLYGKNKYRTKAEFAISGPQGTREYTLHSQPREYTRYPVWRR